MYKNLFTPFVSILFYLLTFYSIYLYSYLISLSLFIQTIFYTWISSIIEDIIPSICSSYALYPQILESILKFIRSICKSFLGVLDNTEQTRGLLRCIQSIAHSLVSCYSSSAGADEASECPSQFNETDEAAIKNLGKFYKLV